MEKLLIGAWAVGALLLGAASGMPAEVAAPVAVVAAPTAVSAADPFADALALVRALSDCTTPWTVSLGLGLILAVGLLRRYATAKSAGKDAAGNPAPVRYLLGPVGAFFGSSEGGSVLLFLVTFGATAGAALSAGKPLTLALAGGACGVALTAAGGWHCVAKPLWQRVLRPLLARWLPGLFPPAATVTGAPSAGATPGGQCAVCHKEIAEGQNVYGAAGCRGVCCSDRCLAQMVAVTGSPAEPAK